MGADPRHGLGPRISAEFLHWREGLDSERGRFREGSYKGTPKPLDRWSSKMHAYPTEVRYIHWFEGRPAHLRLWLIYVTRIDSHSDLFTSQRNSRHHDSPEATAACAYQTSPTFLLLAYIHKPGCFQCNYYLPVSCGKWPPGQPPTIAPGRVAQSRFYEAPAYFSF